MSPTANTRANSASNHFDDTQLESMITKISSKLLNKINDKLEKMTNRFDTIDDTLKSLDAKLSHLEDVEQNNVKQIISINEKLDELNQKSRMNSLRLVGIKEETNENLLSKVLHLLNDGLKIKCNTFEINRVFRIGKFSQNDKKPRSVIVDFVSNMKRNEIYKAKTNLKGTGIFINEDLTDFRFKLLQAARKKFGIKDAWSQNCRIFVKRGNNVEIIHQECDIYQ